MDKKFDNSIFKNNQKYNYLPLAATSITEEKEKKVLELPNHFSIIFQSLES